MNAFTSKTSSRFDPSQRQTKTRTLLVANSNIRQPESFANGEAKPALRLAVKRLIDIVISANALLVLAPLFLAIALLIKLDDGGPVFFRQIRWGLNGRKINVFKFRSMRAEACDPSGIQQTVKGDSRMTAIGAMLRRTNIDELPQLFNIVKGDMAFVGPRPFVPQQEEEYAAKIPFYKERWLVKPGATGWAQINRGYNVTVEDNREKLEYDLFYIKNVSLGLDLFIMFSTVKILLLGRGGR